MRNRKLNRLSEYDYSIPGVYYVTICTKNRIEWFGHIENDRLNMSRIGDIAKQCWQEIPEHFPDVLLDESIIMPNHIHGIVKINNNTVGNENFRSLHLAHSLSSIIKGFKIGVTKWCRDNGFHDFQWQKSFHDRIIRDENELNRIRQYIVDNPINWETDGDNINIEDDDIDVVVRNENLRSLMTMV